MEEHGVEALSDVELLSLLLGGQSSHAEALAAQLLLGGLTTLRALRPGPRPSVPGLRREQADRLCAALELGRRLAVRARGDGHRLLHAGDLVRLFAPRLAHLPHEEFWAVLLNRQLEQIRAVQVCAGGISNCSLLPREAFASAVRHAAPCVAFAHNHPSGHPGPSHEDLRLQMMLEEAGRTLGIVVIDHLVISERGHHSAKEGFLSFAGELLPDEPFDPADLDEPFPIAFTEVDR
jgi:DNA repair protein RadC